MPRKRIKHLCPEALKIVRLITSFMKKEAANGLQYDLKMVQQRTATAVGVAKSTVQRIVTATRDRNAPVIRPSKKRTAGIKTVTGLTSLELSMIKRCVHKFHMTEKKLPTIDMLIKKLKKDIDFKGSNTSMRTILKRLGFKWRAKGNKRKLLIERSSIRLKRIEYLKKLSQYRKEGRPIIYTDETYVDSSHTKPFSKSDGKRMGLSKEVAERQCVVIVHAGSESGFIPNALSLLKAIKIHTNRNNISHETYANWLQTKLIPNLPENSVVVIDNESYHNKLDDATPTSSSDKNVMEDWLRKKNISFSPSLRKPELYQLICLNKEKHEKYYVDNILRAHNHTVLRLPPNHSELNPIKISWAAVEGYIAKKNITWNIDVVMKLVEEKINAMAEPDWINIFTIVREIEEEYKRNDVIIDKLTEKYRIEDSESESSDDSGAECEDRDAEEMDVGSSDEDIPEEPSCSQEKELMETEITRPGSSEWLNTIGREDLINVDDLKHYSYEVCSDHFEESDMKTIKHLHPCVVPTKNIVSKDSKSLASSSGNDLKISTVFSFSETAKKHDLTKEDEMQKKNSEIFVIKSEYQDQEDNEEELSQKFQVFYDLGNILRSKFDGKDTDVYKKFALKFYNSSPQIYTSLQPWLQLPNKSKLIGLKIVIPPKLDDETLESLSMKIKSMPANAKYCSICVDEIKLKPNLYYDLKADEVFGFEIKGDVILPTNYAYVIVLQSLYYNWKVPITYAFCATAKTPSELDVFITEAVTKLFSLDISIVGLITNEKQIFQQYALAKKVTIGRPYFFIDGRIIYYIYDVPSLLKCLHLDLITNKIFDCKQKQIWWEFIKYIYSDQQLKNIKLTPKLTLDHIQPDPKKMTVQHSAQIFSNSVSAALEAYIAFDRISEEAKATAKFIKCMNDLFDVLNCDKDEAKAGFTTEDQVKILVEGFIMFSKMKENEDESKDIRTCRLFLVTIQTMQHLFEELKVERLSHFYTRRLNQDCIVDLLKSAKKGESDPTAIQLTRVISKCFLKGILQNNPCRKLDTNEKFEMAEHVMRKEIGKSSPAPHKSLVSLQGETDYRLDLPEHSTLIYVTSYLLFKCTEKHECVNFQEAMKPKVSLDGNVLFDSYKTYNKQASFYGKLELPPQGLIRYISRLEAAFYDNFSKHINGKLGSSLFEVLNLIPKYKVCVCFPSEYLIKLFIRLRIYDILHSNNHAYKSGQEVPSCAIKIKKMIM